MFRRELRERNPDPAGRRWLYVPYDQLSLQLGPLAEEEREELGIVLVENPAKARRRPYHKQKLALVLANLRQFALEAAEAGVAVRHVVAEGSYADALAPLADELGPLRVMRPAERELRVDLAPLVDDGRLDELPHAGWLTTRADFEEGAGDGPPWRMDAFYRRVRQRTGILMEGGKPADGKYSHDADNRLPWSGDPPAPEPPGFRPDDVTSEVGELVEDLFARHPGELDLSTLPARHRDALRVWRWARDECLEHFGPYEDAMSTRSSGIFHTRVSPLLNLHRLLPRTVVEDVLALDVPLSSKEGFVRQVLGWREFVRHVHEATDGFRDLDGAAPAKSPGDAGYRDWLGKSWRGRAKAAPGDGGARPSALDAHGALPAAFWGAESGLACLDGVVRDVLREGYSHHITRLMVLGNLATLLDVEPRELADWFWACYVDAYDWVVEPNVLAMATFGTGPLMTTKPYVSGAAYLDRMGDACAGCAFDPRKTCPITPLYWAFLARHAERLEDVQRMRLPLRSAQKRPAAKREADRATFERVRAALAAGERLAPDA